jgi:hypothetical protein
MKNKNLKFINKYNINEQDQIVKSHLEDNECVVYSDKDKS